MKPTLNENEQTHYISDSDIISFIEKNSDMKWNDICRFVREVGITSDMGDKVFWERDSVEFINPEAEFWVNAFFEAHPWIKSMMIVFDD